MRRVESILECTSEGLNFALWYLKQRNLVASDDKSALQITVDGMDFLESNKPAAEDVMAFIKPSAITGAPAQSQAKPSIQPKPEVESVMATLNRALARS